MAVLYTNHMLGMNAPTHWPRNAAGELCMFGQAFPDQQVLAVNIFVL